MSKKKEVDGAISREIPVEFTNNHILWTAKNINGTLVVEKFELGKKSNYNLYEECGSEGCQNKQAVKVIIKKDVEYFMKEKNKVHEFLCKCNTFAHLALKRNICIEFAKKIVQAEDSTQYDRLLDNSDFAEGALKELQEKGKGWQQKLHRETEPS